MNYSHKLIGTLLMIFLPVISAVAQQSPITITPEKPTAGDTIEVYYNPSAEMANISNPNNLTLVFGHSNFYELPDDLDMKQQGDRWSVSWKVPNYAEFASFYFKSDKKTDKGVGDHLYEMYVYNENGTPVDGAYQQKGFSLRKRYQNPKKADSVRIGLYKKQLKDNPDDKFTELRLLNARMSLEPSKKEQLQKEAYQIIEENFEQNSDSEKSLRKLVRAYRIMKDNVKADSIRQKAIEKYPTGRMAIRDLRGKVRDMKHSTEKLDALLKILEHTESEITRTNTYEQLFDYYKEEGNTEEMVKYAKKIETSNWPWKVNQLNSIANGFAEKGDSLELALSYAEKALAAVPKEAVGSVRFISKDEFVVGHVEDSVATKERNKDKSRVLATLGLIHMKMNQLDKAEETLQKAIELANTRSSKKNIAQLYMKTDRPKKAFDIYWEILMDEPTNKEYKDKLREAYIAYNGSEAGFQDKTQKINKAWEKKMRKKYKKERPNKEAPSLGHITDLDGNKIDTSSLDNKIVIIDFWATWCGPCLDSFPHFQNMYEEYQENSNVKFMIVNDGRTDSIEDILKWKEDQDYTFPIYYDVNSKASKAFGVRGLPTTYILGKDGNIKFKKMGFEGPIMEKKVRLNIEMLLDKKQSADQASAQK
ncbi:redoxin domain-containing protein [Fodinibius sp.]|uniref:redoxin domain-containing protein n=1 Tax=Fodinibius sp. TaxID=1872440 RepID=UPI002ACE9967|nr:redoxin domain-containing protein [Fodinibius sp.]MDZ7660608.1 redoxin domain-containing protein [Fodinibius sp.]